MENQRRLEAVNSLPIQLGIRLLLDSVCYSNPLPDWVDTLQIGYSERETAIRRKIRSYLMQAEFTPPFEIAVPRKSGEMKQWSIPSVNDQIILQVCVSSIAKSLYGRTIDRAKVFSYRLATDHSALTLTEDHLASWRAFQQETRRRCTTGDCVLQIDIEEAFRSIDRERFIHFLREMFPEQIEVDLLQILLNTFAAGQPGLPLMNDSIFFLGNAYLSVVDKAIARHTANFIRFVDDYRIFGNSQPDLDRVLATVKVELEALGFRIHKIRNDTGESYLDSLAGLKYAETESDGSVENDVDDEMATKEYLAPAITFKGIIPADAMIAQIKMTLEKPQDNLNEGRGRLLMGLLRRARLDAEIVEDHSDGDNGFHALHLHFVGQLSQNKAMMQSILHLLIEYERAPAETWRLVWLLYLVRDVDFSVVSKPTAMALRSALTRIRASQSVATVARLWAAYGLELQGGRTRRQIETLHGLGYIEGGKSLWRV